MLKRFAVRLTIFSAALLALSHGVAFADECAPAAVVSCETAGPQAPRDVDNPTGTNPVRFAKAPPAADMRLCDIHFHRFAEHKVRDSVDAGRLDADTVAALGQGEGYVCREGEALFATRDEPGTVAHREGCQGVGFGDTIEVHWVFTTCDVEPAPCLTSCFSGACRNPQLRVEAQVFYLTDPDYPRPEDWAEEGYAAAPPESDDRVEYLGSTTGSAYNEEDACSPFQVTWSVRRDCRALTLESLDAWCEHNEFEEDHPHGVRSLVTKPGRLSEIR